MTKCSHCQSDITAHYCPECGQQYTGRRLNFRQFLEDSVNSFLSLDRSLWANLKIAFRDPQKLVVNYWDGFRNFYYSPNKFLLTATIFLGINFLLAKNKFLTLTIDIENFSGQLAFLLLMLPLLTFSSYLAYWGFRKNLYEHLVMNSYNLSIWIVVFSIPSIILGKLDVPALEIPLFIAFIGLTMYWNARVLANTPKAKALRTLFNLGIFGGLVSGIVYFSM